MEYYDLNRIGKIETLYTIGDIHGMFDQLAFYSIRTSRIRKAAIVVCGDCGFGFSKPEYYAQAMENLNQKLAEYDIYVYMFRGNHDDRSYFDNKLVDLSNVKTIPDYSVISFNGRNMLCVGGAISIDRKWRIRNDYYRNQFRPAGEFQYKSYWEDENVIYDEEKLDAIRTNKINITDVATHSAPSCCYPLTKDGVSMWMEEDEDLEKDLDEERHTLDKLLDYVKRYFKGCRNWYYGHFHEISEQHRYNIGDINFRFQPMVESKYDRFSVDEVTFVRKESDGDLLKLASEPPLGNSVI